jgi:hypothetical protein
MLLSRLKESFLLSGMKNSAYKPLICLFPSTSVEFLLLKPSKACAVSAGGYTPKPAKTIDLPNYGA